MSALPSLELLTELERRISQRQPIQASGNVRFLCPFHEDTSPSCDWQPKKLVYRCRACEAGGGWSDLAKGLGMNLADYREAAQRKLAPVGVHRYPLYKGDKLLATKIREDRGDGNKHIWYEQPDGTHGLQGYPVTDLPLYWPQPLNVGDKPPTVIVTEGERAADAISEAGYQSAGTVCGAATTPSGDSLLELHDPTIGTDVYLWPDADVDGREHMDRIARRLHGLGVAVRVISWPACPPKGDAADHPDLEGELPDLLRAAKPWKSVAFKGRRLEVLNVGPLPPEPRPPDVVESLVPSNVYTSWVADGGTGKSVLATAIVAASTVGERIAGLATTKTRWLYLDFEDSERVFVDRLRRAFRGLGLMEPFPEVHWANVPFLLRNGVEDLEAAVAELGVEAIVVDTVGPAQGPAEGSAEGATLAMFDALASFRGNKTVLMLDHIAKPSDTAKKGGPTRAIGSIYKGAEVRNSWSMRRLAYSSGPQTHLELKHEKTNHTAYLPPMGLCVTWTADKLVVQQERLIGDNA